MADIVLATLNAKYAHTAFGLRYLMANLGELQTRAEMCEFNIKDRPVDILETLLARAPQVVGLGVYIWNAAPTLELVRLLKAVRPDIVVVLGGPEVSYETSEQAIAQCADYVVCGEGEVTFRLLCMQLLSGEKPSEKILFAAQPETETMPLPYHLYTDEDVARRVMYVEASRGCPYRCEFCLSSLDKSVRRFDLPTFLGAMETLLQRGARQFKFIDRTFNLQLQTSRAILEFFLERLTPELFLHFEMVPDRLPAELRSLIARFPPGVLQFEIGVQTLNPAVELRISRRQDQNKMADNFAFLGAHSGVHVHADLIVGLPGETVESFAGGFDRLFALGPQEIQVGILKRLRGTPIARHTKAFSMVYSVEPPYEVLQTSTVDFATMQRMKRFASFWDKVVNSGRFKTSAPLIWAASDPLASPFWGFLRFSDWLYGHIGQTHAIALDRLAELLLKYLGTQMGMSDALARAALLADYHRGDKGVGRRTPAFLGTTATTPSRRHAAHASLPERQARHLA